VEPDSAVSVRIQYDSEAAVAVDGIVTDWLIVSVLVDPLPPSHSFHDPVRAGRPVLLVIGPEVPVHTVAPDSKPGLPSSWLPPPPPLMVKVNCVEPVAPAESRAVAVTVKVPAAVGVPDTVPVELIVIPEGRPVAVQV
jgi:hypothetical protein